MVESQPHKQIGYVLRSYPRLSQTFILNEILALEQAGVPIRIFALTFPGEKVVQAQVKQVRAPVHYLDESSQPRSFGSILREHLRVAGRHFKGYMDSLLYVAAHGSIDRGYVASGRWKCFLQAVTLANVLMVEEKEAGKSIDHLHAHFAHDPTLIAYLVHRMTGIPFSFTAHARDLFQVPKQALVDRIRRASAVITCCQANLEYLATLAPAQREKLSLVYHGVNLREFRPAPNPEAGSEVPLILSIGRLVEKKGFQDLLRALLIVKERGEPFRCQIFGDGPLCDQLEQWIKGHGMTGEVVLKGDRTQQDLIPVYQGAALFVLTPFQAKDGDRDGIPNVLLEAMAVGLPVVTTAASGIPELVEHDRNGLLYQPHDIEGLASGIMELLRNGDKRRQLGRAASRTVAEHFDSAQAAIRLKALFS